MIDYSACSCEHLTVQTYGLLKYAAGVSPNDGYVGWTIDENGSSSVLAIGFSVIIHFRRKKRLKRTDQPAQLDGSYTIAEKKE